MKIDVYWLAAPHTCARCRWDEQFVEDLVSGHLKRPAGFPDEVVHHDSPPRHKVDFGVVVFPGAEHTSGRDVRWINDKLRMFSEVIVFVAADEGSLFPVDKLTHRHMKLWVQTPRPEVSYPEGTTFFGYGSARAWDHFFNPPEQRHLSWFFAGQDTHPQRHDCVKALSGLPDGELLATSGFLQGVDRSEYLRHLSHARVAPCPGGPLTQDSFRLCEAIEMGCTPVVNATRVDGGGAEYWSMVGADPILRVYDWSEFPALLEVIERLWPKPAVDAQAWWHWRRRDLAGRFRRQLPFIDDWALRPSNAVTVLIPTSPIPSNPSLDIIVETIDSVRERLPYSEILVMCDGVRHEQADRKDAYYEFEHRLLLAAEHRWSNVTPIVYKDHLHQAEMTRRTLQHVESPYLLFVEHDTPLTGEIDFIDVISEMETSSLNSMRFLHESHVLDVHRHLTPPEPVTGFWAPWVPTLQWSQRPHLALTGWYRWVIENHFAPKARTMIEDVMHGVTEDAAQRGFEEGWKDWRMAIYHPEGGIKRSLHLDGRAGEPKYKMFFAYPEQKAPTGAPWPSKSRP